VDLTRRAPHPEDRVERHICRVRPSPRGRWPRAMTFALKRMRHRTRPVRVAAPERRLHEMLELKPAGGDAELARPRTRAECKDGPRPCPWVGCRHHLALDVNPETGSIKLVRPDLEIDELEQSCSLDVADEGSHQLAIVGDVLNITRERVRQIELKALVRMRAARAVQDAGGE
jgi:sigma-70-like protein